jgi:hypothetical protein
VWGVIVLIRQRGGGGSGELHHRGGQVPGPGPEAGQAQGRLGFQVNRPPEKKEGVKLHLVFRKTCGPEILRKAHSIARLPGFPGKPWTKELVGEL